MKFLNAAKLGLILLTILVALGSVSEARADQPPANAGNTPAAPAQPPVAPVAPPTARRARALAPRPHPHRSRDPHHAGDPHRSGDPHHSGNPHRSGHPRVHAGGQSFPGRVDRHLDRPRPWHRDTGQPRHLSIANRSRDSPGRIFRSAERSSDCVGHSVDFPNHFVDSSNHPVAFSDSNSARLRSRSRPARPPR